MQPQELKHCEVVRYTDLAKMASFWETFSGKRFVCCTLTVVYSIYSADGRSIPSIYNLDGTFTLALRASVNMSSGVVYIEY